MAKKESSSKSVTFDAIVRQIREKQFAPVYLLHGDEPFFIDRLCKMFEEGILEPDERDFNQVVLYGKDTEPDMVLANARQFPFGSPYRVVILKEAKELKHIELLDAYVQNPSPQTIFIVCYKYGTMKAAQTKAYASHGVVFHSEGIKDWNLNSWIQNLAEQTFNFRLNPQTAAVLGEHIGNDLSRIFTEFQKLQVVIPAGSEVTPDIVEKYIGISKEYNIFELQEALGSRNLSKAYNIMLNFTLHLRESPNIRTITMLYSFYHKMIRYHLSPDKSNDALRTIFGNLPPSIMARNVGFANNHTMPQLTRIISILREYDLKCKGVDSSNDDAELLKEMIYKITHV